jgi:transmembrane sensor
MRDDLLFRVAAGRASEPDEAEVAAWRAESRANEARFEELMQLLSLARRADAGRSVPSPPDTDTIIGEHRRRSVRPLWRRASGPALLRRRPHVAVAAAAGLVVAAGLAMSVWPLRTPSNSAPPTFGVEQFLSEETQPATVGLRDGSVVRLAPASRLRVLNTPATRRVELTGRAYFAVRSDTTRPFTVETETGTVTVLGTRFDLHSRGGELRLIVVEGSVSLTSRNVTTIVQAGQMAKATEGGVQVRVVPDAAALIDWTGRFVAFQETRLGDAAREIERQYGVRVEFADSALADRTVTAWFAGRSLGDLTQVICIVLSARCTLEGDVLRVEE